MKKIFNFIKQKIDWALIIIGSYMITYGIFDFRARGRFALPLLKGDKTVYGIEYFYPDNIKFKIAFGVVLLVLGILLYKENRR